MDEERRPAARRRGHAKRAVKDDEEDGERREADLRRARDQRQKCLKVQECMGAVAIKEKMGVLRSGEPCSQFKRGCGDGRRP